MSKSPKQLHDRTEQSKRHHNQRCRFRDSGKTREENPQRKVGDVLSSSPEGQPHRGAPLGTQGRPFARPLRNMDCQAIVPALSLDIRKLGLRDCLLCAPGCIACALSARSSRPSKVFASWIERRNERGLSRLAVPGIRPLISSLYQEHAVAGAKLVRNTGWGMGVVLPLAVDDESVLIPARRQPNLNLPASCFVSTETEVTRTPMVEIPGHEDSFGSRGGTRQLDPNSPTIFSNICRATVPAGDGHLHGHTRIVVPFHDCSFLVLGLLITACRCRLVVEFCFFPDQARQALLGSFYQKLCHRL